MRSLLILLAVCAMASAQHFSSVKVVDNARPNDGLGQIPAGGPQTPDISPAWVQNGNADNNRYPGKQYNDPRLRGGK